jgi:hypothetical protein
MSPDLFRGGLVGILGLIGREAQQRAETAALLREGSALEPRAEAMCMCLAADLVEAGAVASLKGSL